MVELTQSHQRAQMTQSNAQMTQSQTNVSQTNETNEQQTNEQTSSSQTEAVIQTQKCEEQQNNENEMSEVNLPENIRNGVSALRFILQELRPYLPVVDPDKLVDAITKLADIVNEEKVEKDADEANKQSKNEDETSDREANKKGARLLSLPRFHFPF